MTYFKFAKLVRDKIVESMRGNNQEPRGVRTLDDNEYIAELIKKVVEEAQELGAITDKAELKNELADLQEVLEYLKKALKISEPEMQELQKSKSAKNGGFENRTYIEDVGVSEDNEWINYYRNNSERYPQVKE